MGNDAQKSKKIWTKLRPVAMIVLSFAIVAVICFGVYNYVMTNYLRPVSVKNTNEITVEIKSGWGTSRIANALYGDSDENRLIRSKAMFKVYVDFVGKGKKMRAGTYTFKQGDSLPEIVSKIAGGNSIQARSIKFTLTEGMTVEDMADRLVLDGVLPSTTEFLALCKTGAGFEAFDIPVDSSTSQRHYALEGYLFPDTYEVYEGTPIQEVIERLLLRFNGVMEASYYERMEELDMTQDQIITMASIIEKEAQTDDFTKVSAVLHNRLKSDIPLQSDATIRYELDVSTISLTKEQLAKESPYNTHLNKGLPIGPICNPGKAAIEAALYPDQTMLDENYLYFTLMEPTSGRLVFTKTLEEHNQEVQKYKALWEEYDRQQGNTIDVATQSSDVETGE